MMKVNLSSIICRSGKYIVFLDSENRYTFNDKRKAKDFLRHINKRINACLLFFSEEFLELNKYHQHYFFNDDYKLRSEIQNSIEFISIAINSILVQSLPATLKGTASFSLVDNRNTYVIKAVERCFFEFLMVYKTLIGVSISRWDSLTRQRLELRYRLTELYMIDFKHFEEKINVKYSKIELEKKLKSNVVLKRSG